MTRADSRSYKELGLTQLRSFCYVCRLGGFAPAARELLLTTPAVWEQIKGLERTLNLVLLERSGNRVRPTAQGRHLLELAQPLLASLDSIHDVLHQRAGALPEKVTIVTTLRVLVDEVTEAMLQFRQRYPTVTPAVKYVGSTSFLDEIQQGPANVALTLEPGPDDQTNSALTYEPTGELEYLLLTPPDHPLLSKKPFLLESIVDYELVLGNENTYSRHRVQEIFHRHDLHHRIKLSAETSSDEYTVHCVRGGLGLGIVVGTGHSRLHHGLGVRSLRRWFGFARCGFQWRSGAHIPALDRELADILHNVITRRRPADDQ
ncbi:LysR family transcriptional regulator [Planctomicrobium sp. SH664]|uniref:LysR family transcriptional regulator n=1 Tax=Planctomicrobium sp. SH664 TaxID=3448125 RepID=UPI003F5BCC93